MKYDALDKVTWFLLLLLAGLGLANVIENFWLAIALALGVGALAARLRIRVGRQLESTKRGIRA